MKFDKSAFDTPTIRFEKGFSQESKVAEALEEFQDHLILVVAGRSNVGKSSFINQLLKDKLAKTSKTPGRTQEINLFSFSFRDSDKKIYMFDLPGYGYAKISKETKKKWNQLLAYFFSCLPESAYVFQIQDAKITNQKSDQEFLDFASEAGPETYLILNKIDKLKNQKEKGQMKIDAEKIREKYFFIQGVFKTSTTKNIGFTEIREFIHKLAHDSRF